MRVTVSFLSRVARYWRPFQTIGQVLGYCRFSVFVVALGGAVLVLSSQGREIALRVTDNPLHTLAFFVGVFFWALQSWFWARRVAEDRRASLDNGPHELDPFGQWLIRHVPRIIGTVAYAIATTALLHAGHHLLAITSAAIGIVFYILLMARRPLMKRYLPEAFVEDSSGGLAPIQKGLMWITLGYGIVFTLLACLSPPGLGFSLGAAGVLFFALSSIVPVGSWLIYQTREQGFPVITGLLLIAVIFSFFNDNHRLRTTGSPPQVQAVSEALVQWTKQAPAVAGNQLPFVVVATAGGGLRAAQWTATVLAGLADAEPNFRTALFAVSGVSGGSVGATFVTATLREDDRACDRAQALQRVRGPGTTCYEWQVRTALSNDFLGPTVAGMLYPDLLQRFFPIPINALPDRAEALERAFEVGWRNALQGELRTAGLSHPFTTLWKTGPEQGRWLPALLLNATHQETGKRIVISNLVVEPTTELVFNDAIDLFQLIGVDLPASTAAASSARFTYVSPPGTLPCREAAENQSLVKTIIGDPRCNQGHVLDGGYFENFGAVTALELLRFAVSSPELHDQLQHRSARLRPLVVLISSDPELDPVTISSHEPVFPTRGDPGANESLGPVRGLLNTRNARGILAARELLRWVEDCALNRVLCGGEELVAAPSFFHFHMTAADGLKPALGWLLSLESEDAIWQMLGCAQDNRESFDALLTELGTAETQRNKAVTTVDCTYFSGVED